MGKKQKTKNRNNAEVEILPDYAPRPLPSYARPVPAASPSSPSPSAAVVLSALPSRSPQAFQHARPTSRACDTDGVPLMMNRGSEGGEGSSGNETPFTGYLHHTQAPSWYVELLQGRGLQRLISLIV